MIKEPQFEAFFGLEHGSLFTIQAAREKRKKSVVTFTSPHHVFREKWVDSEYKKFPELSTVSQKRLIELGRIRDKRSDEEAKLTDVICTNSNLVTQTLVAAGFLKDKIITVSLGGPPAIPEELLPGSLPAPMRFIYAGPISVRKGAHYLLQAWKAFDRIGGIQLHFYGAPLLPKRFFNKCAENVIFHGPVSQDELSHAYQQAAILILPTLCDGFGLVITEALARGLPVSGLRTATWRPGKPR